MCDWHLTHTSKLVDKLAAAHQHALCNHGDAEARKSRVSDLRMFVSASTARLAHCFRYPDMDDSVVGAQGW